MATGPETKISDAEFTGVGDGFDSFTWLVHEAALRSLFLAQAAYGASRSGSLAAQFLSSAEASSSL